MDIDPNFEVELGNPVKLVLVPDEFSDDGKTPVFKDKPGTVAFTFGKYSVTLVLAESQTGKTSLSKAMILQIHKQTGLPVIIFDPRFGGWEDLAECNYYGKYPDCVDDVFVVKNFGFKLSDFGDEEFYSLGFSAEVGRPIIASLAKMTDLHGNDPKKLERILIELPTNEKALIEYNNEHGGSLLERKSFVPSTTKASLLNRWMNVRNIFLKPDDKRKYIKDFGKLFKAHPCLCIKLDLAHSEQRHISSTLVGMIMKTMPISLLKEMSPLMVFDELDMVCPSIAKAEFSLSRNFILLYAIKYMRYGIKIIGITQHPNLISTTLLDTCHQRIVGKIGGNKTLSERTKFFKRRIFMLINKETNGITFKALESPCKC